MKSFNPDSDNGKDAVDFYKSNASVTTILDNGTKYVAVINDYNKIDRLYFDYQGGLNQINTNYISYTQDWQYAKTPGDITTSSEYALYKIFGDAITIFKAAPNTDDFQPLKRSGKWDIVLTLCP